MTYMPCKDCTNRTAGCHGKCSKYAVFIIENKKATAMYRRGKKEMIWGGKAPDLCRYRMF